jgi:hypothetical protein
MSGLLQTDAASAEQTHSLHDERRLIARVLRHWTEMAAGRGFPRLGDIDPWMVGDDWRNCLLVAVQSPIECSRFITVGDNLFSESSRLLDGAAIGLCPRDALAGVILLHLPEVLTARRCVIAEGTAIHRGGVILYRSALLPLSEDGTIVDHVLGAANHRALRRDEAQVPTTKLIWAPPAN